MNPIITNQIKRSSILIRLGALALIAAALGATSTQNLAAAGFDGTKVTGQRAPLYSFTLTHDGTPESYDEAMAVACLQGIINR